MGYEGLPFLVASADADEAAVLARLVGHTARRPTERATTAVEARSRLRARPAWAGVLSDVALGSSDDTTGLELVGDVAEWAPGTPTLVFASNPDRRWVNRLASLGVPLVCKPFGVAELHPFVRRALDAEHLRSGADDRLCRALDAEVQPADIGGRRAGQLLRLVVAGRTREEVQELMKIGPDCYAYHVGQLLRATGAPDLQALVIRIMRHALGIMAQVPRGRESLAVDATGRGDRKSTCEAIRKESDG